MGEAVADEDGGKTPRGRQYPVTAPGGDRQGDLPESGMPMTQIQANTILCAVSTRLGLDRQVKAGHLHIAPVHG